MSRPAAVVPSASDALGSCPDPFESSVQQGEAEQRFEERIRRALATPPISNEEILRRSKERKHAKN